MESSLLRKAAGFMLERRRRKRWQKVVSSMAAVVVFCTTYALILPAITMSDDATCGLEAHAHTETCWTTETRYPQSSMACTFTAEGAVAHEHDGLCYSEDGTLICTMESLALHQHEDSCYAEETTQICTETEDLGHTHSDDCYTKVQGELTCTQAEDQGHSHGETCYQVSSELTCTEESEEHSHEAGCYTESELLVCQEEERPGHAHDDSCYSWTQEQTCTEEERPAGHIHEDACYQTNTILTCELEQVVLHTHEVACYDEAGVLVCELPEVAAHQHTEECIIPAEGEPWEEQVLVCTLEVHTHSESCYPAEEQAYICGLEVHTHEETCYDADGNLTCVLEEHTHAESCYPAEEQAYICGLEVHTHEETCYDADGNLICALEEHTHAETCYPAEEQAYICGLEVHAHEETCYDADGNLICALEEHTHAETCYPAEEQAYICGLEVHTHEETCYDADGNLICALEEHTHAETCYPAEEQEYICGLEVHAHEETCYDADGNLICALEEHTHTDACNGLSEAEQAQVDEVIAMIDELPTYEEMEATLLAYEEAEDWDGYEAYFTEIGQSGLRAHNAYTALTEEQQAQVTNIDKLMDLSSVWSVATLETETYDYDPLPYAAENTTIHLFDYGPYINTWVSDGQALLPFYRIWPEYSYTVDGEASWDHDDVNGTRHGQIDGFAPILETKLGSDGYPAVNQGSANSWHVTAGSLRYLFDPTYGGGSFVLKDYWRDNIYANTSFSVPYTNDATESGNAFKFRKAYFPVENDDGTGTGLFQRDGDGYWYYNSGKNAAWYNPETEKFELYDYTVIPGHEAFANYGETTNGNFLPFNKGHVEGLTDYQTDESKVHDKDPDTSDGTVFWNNRIKDKPYGVEKENFRLITSDRTNSVNVNFGMTVEFDFYMPKNGQINGKDMVFEFSGDDDVWVFIDDVLVLDIGGCHGKETGSINFAKGTVTPPDADAGYYKNTTIEQMYSDAGKNTVKFVDSLFSEHKTFDNYTVHHLKFFYMERGGNVSNCYLRFNMPQIDKNTLNVTKALEPDQEVDLLGSPDYYFSVLELNSSNVTNKLFIGPSSNGVNSITGITTYKVKNSDGSYVLDEDGKVKVFTVGEYGIFSIKAGQTAVFEKIPANAGNFYVQEMIKERDYAQYPGFTVNNGKPQWNGIISWEKRDYYPYNDTIGPGGYTWYGVSGPTTNASSSSAFIFEQQNQVATSKLAQLSITKRLSAYNDASASQTYKINVELDGEPLPAGTTYTVGSATRKIGFDSSGNSYVELAGGETAVISNILSGTQFHVWESEASANGHTVTYSNTSASGNGENVQVTSDGVTGTIRVSDHVQLTVSNTQYGNTVTIPLTKSFANFVGGPYTYNFTLTEMASDGSGGWTAGETLQTKSVSFSDGSEPTTIYFDPLTYLKHNFTSLPAVKYYMVEETGEVAPTLDNTTQYLVEVTISEVSTTKGIQAVITNVLQRPSADGTWTDIDLNGVGIATFVNTLAGDLTVTKTVSGSSVENPTTQFDFTLTLESGTSGVALDSFLAVKTLRDGSVTQETVTATPYTFKLRHGDSITFKGIPVGTEWTVTEKEHAGFIQSWTVGDTSGTTSESTGTVTTTGTQVAYTNTACYTLPETGGAGSQWYTMAGGLIMMAAAYLLYRENLRRKEELSSTS